MRLLRNVVLLALCLILCLLQPAGVLAQGFDANDLRDVNEKNAFFAESEACAPGRDCTCEGSILLAGANNAERVWNFFSQQGMKPHQVAGLMGNMRAEANFEPRLVEYGWKNSRGETSKPGDPSSLDDTLPPKQGKNGEPGYGIVQWTSPGRKDSLVSLADSKGVPVSDLGLQLDHVMQELNTGYKARALDPLLASNTAEEAADIIMRNYEIPGNMARQGPIRRNFAREFLATFGSGTGIRTVSAASTGDACAISLDSSNCPADPIDVTDTVEAEGIRVHPCISTEVERIIKLAREQGHNMSGWGWRSVERQIELRIEHGCGGSRINDRSCRGRPPTAVPGRSRHERGSAVDFTCDGNTFKSHSHPCFQFLRENTSLINLPSEAWHWSIDGG